MIPLAATLGPLLWSPCPELGATAECATVQAPEDHDDVEAGLLSMALRRVPALETPARGQLWYIAGGPGVSGIEEAQRLESIHASLAPDLELLTLDVRGVGFSARMGCAGEARGLTAEEWRGCAEVWEAPSAGRQRFTTTQAAVDLLFALTRAQAEESGPVHVWTTGYGALLVDRMLSIEDEGIASVVVDGAMPVDWSASEADATMDAAARAVAARCGADADCAGWVTEDPAGFAEALIDRVEDGHCAGAGLDGAGVREVGASLLLAGASWAQHLPAYWARLDRCRGADRRALATFLDQIPGSTVEAPVLARHVALTDLWDGVDTLSGARERVDQSIASDGLTLELATAEWPRTDPGAYHRFPPTTAVPTLLLHGALDPRVGIARARERSMIFQAAEQHWVAVQGVGGRPVLESGCALDLARGFLADPSAPVAGECAEELDLAGGGDVDEARWGTPDRYGASVGCAVVSGPARGLGLVWALVVGVGLLRRRSPS